MEDPSEASPARPLRQPLKPLIDPNHRRQPSGNLSEIDAAAKAGRNGNDTSRARGGMSRGWFVAFGVLVLIGFLVLGFVHVLSESPESQRFRELAEEKLSEQLQADVRLAPISANSFFFARTSEVRIGSREGEEGWAICLKNVSIELDPKSFTGDAWRITRFQAGTAELDLGPGASADSLAVDADAAPSWAAKLAESMKLGAIHLPTSIQMPEMVAGQLIIRGRSGKKGPAGFEIKAPASGAYQDGALSFEMNEGSVRVGDAPAWGLETFSALVTPGSGGITVETAALRSRDGARLEASQLTSTDSSASGAPELAFAIDAERIPIGVGEERSLDPVFASLTATGKGEVRAPLTNPLDFAFRGKFDLRGLRLSQTGLFDLLANQTGDNRFRHLNDETLSATVEWSPDRLSLAHLELNSDEFLRMDGAVKIEADAFEGEIQLELPAATIVRMPGGKPAGFGYPASGWSQAKVALKGTLASVQEDLSARLLEEIAPEVTVSAAPLEESVPTPDSEMTEAQKKERNAKLEELFFGLIEGEEE